MYQTSHKTKILLTVIFMDLLAGMEVDLFTPSFPELQIQFNLSSFWIEALLSVNFVGYCLSLFLVGSLADSYGRKSISLIGITVFIIGTILCLSGSYMLLLIGRFFQGAGIAAPSILSFLIIADIYSLKEQQYYMAMLNSLINISIGLAPLIGSYVTLYFHWQGNFWVLLMLALMTLIMTIVFIPTYKLSKVKEPLSVQAYGSVCNSKPLMFLITTLVLIFLPYWIFVGISPLLYMKDLGVRLEYFGYYQGSIAVVFALGSLWYGFVMHKYEQRKMLYFSNVIFVLSLILMFYVTLFASTHPLLITCTLVIFCVGQIIPSIILYPLCLGFMPQIKGQVSAMIQGFRLILTAFSLQLAGCVYQGCFQNIGIILMCSVTLAIFALFFVLKNDQLMNNLKKNS